MTRSIAILLVAIGLASQIAAFPGSENAAPELTSLAQVFDRTQERSTPKICVAPQSGSWSGLVLNLRIRNGYISGLTNPKTGTAAAQGFIQGQILGNNVFFCVVHNNAESTVRSSTCFAYLRDLDQGEHHEYAPTYYWTQTTNAPYSHHNTDYGNAIPETLRRVPCA